MKIDIEELKRLAEAATPGPWEYDYDDQDLDTCNGILWGTNNYAIAILPYDGQVSDEKVTATGNHIAAANPAAVLELIRQRDAALGGLGLFMDAVDRPPERNCSCHISPPCNDCVENSGLREAFEYAEEIIANTEKSQ